MYRLGSESLSESFPDPEILPMPLPDHASKHKTAKQNKTLKDGEGGRGWIGGVGGEE